MSLKSLKAVIDYVMLFKAFNMRATIVEHLGKLEILLPCKNFELRVAVFYRYIEETKLTSVLVVYKPELKWYQNWIKRVRYRRISGSTRGKKV